MHPGNKFTMHDFETGLMLAGKIPVQETDICLSKSLPYETHYPACNIETKEEILVPSGELVHCYLLKNVLYVSQSIWDGYMLKKDVP